MIPLAFVLTAKISIKKFIVYCSLTTICVFFLSEIIDVLTNMLSVYENYSYGMLSGSVNAIVSLVGICIFVFYSLKFEVENFDINSLENRILINGTFLCLIFLILGIRIYMMTRFSFFFRPFACVLVANIIAHYKNKKNKLIVTIVILIIATLYTVVALYGTAFVPYYFFWEV